MDEASGVITSVHAGRGGPKKYSIVSPRGQTPLHHGRMQRRIGERAVPMDDSWPVAIRGHLRLETGEQVRLMPGGTGHGENRWIVVVHMRAAAKKRAGNQPTQPLVLRWRISLEIPDQM